MSLRTIVLGGMMTAAVACAPTGAVVDDGVDQGGADGSELALAALPSSDYARTHHPIVLAHGMGGFDRMFDVFEYFYGIPAELRAGGAAVFITHVPPFADAGARGEALLAQVEYIAASSGTGKVNLIGHSQGGIDARYVLAARPDLLASVTTVGTPHQGAELADWLLAHADPDGLTGAALDLLGDVLGTVLDLLAGTDDEHDALASLDQLSSAGMKAFNAALPAGLPPAPCGQGAPEFAGVRLYSWTGVAGVTNVFDVGDLALKIAALVQGGDNDGLVSRCSAHFGTVVRDDYRMNHLDQVNQVSGLVALFGASPRAIFRQHANRLKLAGL